jgi:bifunctional DNA-binding transcriptional regulator/antitoxin component of YhaV-PrlF toxin-antitoxin module
VARLEKMPTTECHGVENQLFHVKVSDGRRVVLPHEACKELGVEVGDTLIVNVGNGKVELHTFDTTLAEFRALLASKVPPGVSVVDELLAERRDAANRE